MLNDESMTFPPTQVRTQQSVQAASRAPHWRSPSAHAVALAGLLFATHTAAQAGEGDLDATFGIDGVARAGITNVSAASPAPRMLIQSDGKVVLCATTYDAANADFNMFVARLGANGGLDTSFSFDGRVSIDFGDGGSDGCTSVALQDDGKLVVGGFTDNHLGAGNLFAIARLNVDGSLDTAFGNGSGKVTIPFTIGGTSSALARAVAIQADGRIVVAGSAARPDSGRDFAVARLLSDGSLDSTFNLTGKVTIGFGLPLAGLTEGAWALALDRQGRILAAGSAGARFAIARLRANGTLDGDFDSDGLATVDFGLGATGSVAYALAVQRDGRIVLTGRADASDSSTPNFDMAALRMQPDGSLDSSFGFQGKTVVAFNLTANGNDGAYAVLQQSDGRLLLGGYATGPNQGTVGAIARMTLDGDLDPSFGAAGRHTYDLGFDSGSIAFSSLGLQGTHPMTCGVVPVGAGNFDVIAMRMQTELVFATGFE